MISSFKKSHLLWVTFRASKHVRIKKSCTCPLTTSTCKTKDFSSLAIIRRAHGDVVAGRQFCRVTDSRCTDLYMEELFEAGISEEDPFGDHRYILFPEILEKLTPENKSESHHYRLAQAASLSEVFDIIDELGDNFTHIHAVQALVTLFHLQKFLSYFVDYADEADYLAIKADFNRKLLHDDHFKKLVKKAREHIMDIPLQASALIFLSLRRMELPLSSPIMQDLVIQLKKNKDLLDSTTLSYFCVGLRGRNTHESKTKETTLSWFLTLGPSMPNLRRMIDEMETHEDVKKIAIILNTVTKLASKPMMEAFKQNVEAMIKERKFQDVQALSSLVKVVLLNLTIKDWHLDKANFTRLLLSEFTGRTHFLRPVHLLIVSKVISDSRDPLNLYVEVRQAMLALYKKTFDFELLNIGRNPVTDPKNWTKENHNDPSNFLPRIDFLSSLSKTNPNLFSAQDLEPVLWEIVNGTGLIISIPQVFDLVRNVCFKDQKLIDTLLNRTLEICQHEMNDLGRLALRYLNFKSVLGGVVKSESFEEKLVDIFLKDAEETNFPGRFAIQFGFLLAFSPKIPSQLLQRLQSLASQINPFGIYCICRGVESRQFWLYKVKRDNSNLKNFKADLFYNKSLIEDIEIIISKRSREILSNGDMDFSDYFTLFKSFLARSNFYPDDGFVEALEKMYLEKFIKIPLSLNLIRQITASLVNLRPVLPTTFILDHIVDQVSQQKHEIHFSGLSNILTIAFQINTKIRNQSFLELCSSSLIRDMDSLHCQQVIESAISLAKFNHLKPELVMKIFSQEFMEKIDAELQVSYFYYTRRVRRSLMELNRTVCLRYPEYKVPWFHEKYCQEEAGHGLKHFSHSTVPRLIFNQNALNQVRDEVYDSLIQIVGGPSFLRENVFSQYYNHIDFEVWQDEEGNFAPLHEMAPSYMAVRKSVKFDPLDGKKWKKIAIIVNFDGDYTLGKRNLVGLADLNEKNLKLQGYDVITISPFGWNSMNMTVRGAKNDYLQKVLIKKKELLEGVGID